MTAKELEAIGDQIAAGMFSQIPRQLSLPEKVEVVDQIAMRMEQAIGLLQRKINEGKKT